MEPLPETNSEVETPPSTAMTELDAVGATEAIYLPCQNCTEGVYAWDSVERETRCFGCGSTYAGSPP